MAAFFKTGFNATLLQDADGLKVVLIGPRKLRDYAGILKAMQKASNVFSSYQQVGDQDVFVVNRSFKTKTLVSTILRLVGSYRFYYAKSTGGMHEFKYYPPTGSSPPTAQFVASVDIVRGVILFAVRAIPFISDEITDDDKQQLNDLVTEMEKIGFSEQPVEDNNQRTLRVTKDAFYGKDMQETEALAITAYNIIRIMASIDLAYRGEINSRLIFRA